MPPLRVAVRVVVAAPVGKIGCTSSVVPVRNREAYVECRAWVVVGRGARGGFGGNNGIACAGGGGA